MTEIQFKKYHQKGAYHWNEYFGSLRQINAYTKARYDIVAQCLIDGGLRRNAHVLDVGCGDGALAGVLVTRLGCRLSGVDNNALAVDYAVKEFAKRGFAGDFQIVDGYQYAFEDGTFDAIVCSEVIEHVGEPETMLREIRRLLKPDGILILTTPIRFTELPLDPMHVQEWFVDEFVVFSSRIFGAPEKILRTHPVIWYEAYSHAGPILGRVVRLTINALTKLGFNPFVSLAKSWRCYTTQALVLRKHETSETHR